MVLHTTKHDVEDSMGYGDAALFIPAKISWIFKPNADEKCCRAVSYRGHHIQQQRQLIAQVVCLARPLKGMVIKLEHV